MHEQEAPRLGDRSLYAAIVGAILALAGLVLAVGGVWLTNHGGSPFYPIAGATDNLIRAIDMRTDRTLWQDTLPAGGQATPSAYAVNGKQFLVIMAGGHHVMEIQIGDALVTYALPI